MQPEVSNSSAVVRRLGMAAYEPTFRAMRDFTLARNSATPDEIWLLEHPAVFTLGTNADPAHVLNAGDIPVVKVDRGGQVTYHGPGQLVAYVLLDLARARLGVRDTVCRLERAVTDTLARYHIAAAGRAGAPGVYCDDAKIASVGLRVRHNRTYHGVAINVNCDLAPFGRINPCGYAGMAVTSIEKCGGPADMARVTDDLLEELLAQFGLAAEFS